MFQLLHDHSVLGPRPIHRSTRSLRLAVSYLLPRWYISSCSIARAQPIFAKLVLESNKADQITPLIYLMILVYHETMFASAEFLDMNNFLGSQHLLSLLALLSHGSSCRGAKREDSIVYVVLWGFGWKI